MFRILVTALLLAGAPARADDGWRRVDLEDGILVETRDVDGSPIHEVRATTHTGAAPQAILAVLWRHEEHPTFLPHLHHLEVLQDAPDTRLLYEQFSVPILKDRDAVLRTHRTVDATTGVVDVESRSVTDEGPPPSTQFVRVRSTVGHWHLVPGAQGGADVTYTIRTDVGGMVPAWIANRAQHETVPRLVRAILDRATATARP